VDNRSYPPGAAHNGPMSPTERARHWRHADLPGLDLLRARYVAKTFPPHTHDSFVIAAVCEGVEEFHHRGSVERAGPGSVAMINPDTPHTGYAGVPEGWVYRVLYPQPDLVHEIAAETQALRGGAAFSVVVADDPRAAGMVVEIHRAAEEDDVLAADSLLRLTVAHLLGRYGGTSRSGTRRGAGARTAALARDALTERMAAPPTLAALAEELHTSPFALLRAFRTAYGMPPHTWLTDARVRRARALLDAGASPARAAHEVGFSDQPHLTRHFTRIVGVPPGAYQRERKNVQDSRRGHP
jgi:AraC-like DNA-binding protein